MDKAALNKLQNATGEEPEPLAWPDQQVTETVAPNESVNCIKCGKRDDMYSELPVKGDWHGRGFVMRIGCLCDDENAEKDDDRTDFLPYLQAIEQWNKMNVSVEARKTWPKGDVPSDR